MPQYGFIELQNMKLGRTAPYGQFVGCLLHRQTPISLALESLNIFFHQFL